MEPEIQEQEESLVEQKSSLHQVTPLSKYLALALFIILPFLGGWVGYTFAPVYEVVPPTPIGGVDPSQLPQYPATNEAEVESDKAQITDSGSSRADDNTAPGVSECVDYPQPICHYGWNTHPSQACPQAAECLYDELIDAGVIDDIEIDSRVVKVSIQCSYVNNVVMVWGDGEETQPCYLSSRNGGAVEEVHTYDVPGTYMLSILNRDSWNDGNDWVVEQKRVEVR